MATLKQITGFLDKELRIDEFDDSSNNGLQVENSGRITGICCGVDASMDFFREVKDHGANLLVCHHGLSWGDSLKRITGLTYQRISYLLKNDIALYACHLPLDAHPKYGNNVQICQALGLVDLQPFGLYHGKEIGFEGRFPRPVSYDQFKKMVSSIMGFGLQSMDFGKKRVDRVAVVSGGAAQLVEEAGQKNIDVYLSGEPLLSAYSLAQEYQLNAIFAGHYATEVFGVRALVGLLKKKFKIRVDLINMNIPY